MSKQRIKLVVAYDGYDFCGWAPQEGRRTVHRTLTDAVREVAGEDCDIIGASRTDSGAHALGQTCHFDTENPMPVDRWVKALNRVLPDDLAAVQASVVSRKFHARFSADKRWYRYRIQSGIRDPHRGRTTYFYDRELDLAAMKKGASQLEGEHDFLAFSQEMPPEKNTVRRLFRVELTSVKDEIRIDIEGTAFIRGMMRRMSGGLFEIGRGARDPDSILDLLQEREKPTGKWPTVLPAKGLTLMKVFYGRHPIDCRTKEAKETDDE